ncbi:MAG TPA: serine/threonine-protein kinase [Bryobacteraceae bacterium]|nr:serine/threonine-protein kinase [Bryobacteraceae bacterium]
MTPTKWQRVQDLVTAALDLPAPERADFLDAVCSGNAELRHQIEDLIRSYEEAGSFLEESVAASAFEVFGAGAPAQGDRIGPYQITCVIGHGGMGSVYCANRMDDQFRQQVAIKVLRGGFGASTEMLTRFRAERQILASLTHPNIARLLDGGITPSGLPYLVMEYIEGTTIDVFSENRKLPIRDRLGLFRQVCAAVQYAHQNLIVHRDIKPANVMVTREGTPKLLDFGIAKLLRPDVLGQTVAATRPAERLMTPEYASPEQIRGDAISTATDLYGLGVLLYELLTGTRPFRTEKLTPANLERVICESSPERPSTAIATAGSAVLEKISGDLDNIVLKAMHKDPARRYASATELSEDVGRYLQGFPVSARTDSWSYRASKFLLRHKVASAAAALFVLTTTALSVGLAIQATRARQEAETANQVSDFLVNLFEFSRPDKTQGRNSYARDLVDLGAQRATGELAGQPIVEARLLDMLGTTYRELGVFDRAESLLTQAYRIRSRSFGPESKEAAESLQTLAEIASDKGDFERASQAYEHVLGIWVRIYGRMNEKTAEVIDDIGELRWELGDFEGAKKRYLEAIDICNRIKGPTDWQTLNDENDLQVALAGQGDYAAAEALARKVLATEIQVFGPTNPNVGLTLNNLGYILAQMAHYRESEAIFKRALDLRRRVDGSEHPAVALSLSNLGWLARELGHYDEAKSLGERALAMATKLEGPRSLGTTACQGQLGLTMLAIGDFGRARELLAASLATRLALGNPNNPELADNYDRMGQLELATRNPAAARQDIERGLDIRMRFYGRNNDTVASSLDHLGEVLMASKDYAAAEQKFREAIQIARTKFNGPHTITADALLGLGTALVAQGRATEAKTPLMEALTMRRNLLPADHPAISEAEAALAKCTGA